MDEDRIKEALRSKLLDHETPINLEQIWAGIDQKQDKKRRAWWLYLGVGLFGLFGVASMFLMNHNETRTSSINNPDTNNRVEVKDLATNRAESQTKVETVNSRQAVTKNHEIVNQTSFQSREDIDNKLVAKSDVNKMSSKLQKPQARAIKEVFRSRTPRIDPDQEVAQNNVFKTVASIVNAIKEKDSNATTSKSSVSGNTDMLAVSSIAWLKHYVETETYLLPNPSRMALGRFVPFKPERKTENKRPWLWQLEIYSGIFNNLKEISSIGADQIYLNERLASETPLETVFVGSRVKTISPSGFMAYTGIEMMRITEKFEFTRVLNMTPQANFQSKVSIRNIEKKIYNQLSLIEIPLGVGYLSTYKKMGLELSGGINYNIALSAQGQLLNKEILPMDIENLDLYKKSVGLSYTGMLGLSYRLNDGIQTMLGIKYKHYRGSFNLEQSGLSQRHKFIGLQLGLSYQF